MRSNIGKAIVAVAAVTAVAGAIRLADLGHPGRKVFDEVYYASDGCWYAGIDHEECGLDQDVERSWVHPPLGKVMISWGIDAFGNRPFGWRVPAAVAGTLTVGFAGGLAFLLFGSWIWAAVGALLVATEHLLFVQSRIAMLDIFLAMFVVLGFLLLVWDRARRAQPVASTSAPEHEERWLDAPPEPHDEPGPGVFRPRPLRVLAGCAFGAAVAVKWSGLFALAGAIPLALGWEWASWRRGGEGGARLLGRWLAVAGALLLVPAVAYLATWSPWLEDREGDVKELVRHHGDMGEYHLELDTLTEEGEPTHPYMSRAWEWPLLRRPVSYHWKGTSSHGQEILAIGNPAIFWGSLLAVPYLLLSAVRRRDWRRAALVAAVLTQYLPWLAVRRPLFLFYMTPVAPFLALSFAAACRDLAEQRFGSRRLLVPAGILVAASLAAFVFFWPLLTAQTLPLDDWRARIWFGSWV